MKSIYLLERLHHILNALPEEDQKQAEYFLKNMSHYYGTLNTPAAIVTDLIKEVIEDIRRESARDGGKLAEQKAAEKILDQVPEGRASGGYMSGDRQIVGGAYSVVRLCSPLPVREFPAGASPLDYDKLLNDASKNAGAKKKATEAQETIDTIQKVMPETAPRDEALDILDYLLSHNKNYTKTQYYKLLDLQEILEKR